MRPTRIVSFLAGLLVLCLLLPPSVLAAEDGIVWMRPVPGPGGSGTELLILADTQVNDGMLLIEYDTDVLTYTGLLPEDAVALYSVNARTPGSLRLSWVCDPYAADGSGVLLFRICFDGTAGVGSIAVSCQTHGPEGQEIPLGTVDVSGLEAALAEAGRLNALDYSAGSWAALTETTEAGRRVLRDPMASRQEIAGAAQAILDAIGALEAPEIPETTEASHPTEIPETTEATQPQPSAPDTRELERLLEKAGKINGSDYTRESYASLQAAMQKAREILADSETSQAAVDSAARNLETALAGLKRIPGSNAETGDAHRPGLAAALAVVSLLGIAGAGWRLAGKGWRR